MQKLGNIEILTSSCNLSTIKDGRGGIFTWMPQEPILEFNLLYFLPNKVRGNHYHPEFVEYFLVVEGSGVIVTKNPKGGRDFVMHASKGTCIRIPKGVSHVFHAITEATCISMLSKPWDECNPPIIREHLVPFDKQYIKSVKETKKAKKTKERKSRKV